MEPKKTVMTPESRASSVSALQEHLREKLVAVVLFGSRARGDAREDSDWDLLVIARDLPEKTLARHFLVKRVLPPDERAGTAVLAMTPEEFEASVTNLLLDVALDGIILFEQAGYANERLSRLRRLIRAKGLKREQDGRDYTWHWERFPGFDWALEWEMSP